MTISTNFQFNQSIAQMQELQSSIARIQQQVASGLAQVRPSDDPDKINAIQRIQSALSRQENYQEILGTVSDRLKTEENSLRGASDLLARLKELLLQAANATTSPSDRQNIAVVMDSMRGELQSLASVRDVEGLYLFSGTRAGLVPFDPADDLNYAGDRTSSRVQIGDQQFAVVGRPGTDAFGGLERDAGAQARRAGFFAVIGSTIEAVRAGSTPAMSRAISEIDGLGDQMAKAQARNGADQKVLEGQRNLIDETTLRLKTTLSSLRDVDMTEAITRLQKESIGLQAAQSAFSRVSNLNLFNFLK